MRIIAEHLTYTYNRGSEFAVKALDDVHLTIEEGEFFGIIGHTGSGKSTFIQHLNALIPLPSASKKYKPPKLKKGETPPPKTVLSVGDFDLTDRHTDFKALRAKVGMVFQYPEYQLFAETVAEDVAFGLKNFRPEVKDEALTLAVREALEAVGLDYEAVKDQSPFDLSGGQKRRVAIAGVIVTRPEVLVLDEPAAGLDPLGKKEIISLLHRLHKEWCKTVVIVSHDMDEVAENCSRVAVFSGGKVRFSLPPSELFTHREELLSLGLDLPVTAKVVEELRKEGMEINCNFTTDDFIERVTEYLSKGGGKEC